jgi:hypothetical protein
MVARLGFGGSSCPIAAAPWVGLETTRTSLVADWDTCALLVLGADCGSKLSVPLTPFVVGSLLGVGALALGSEGVVGGEPLIPGDDNSSVAPLPPIVDAEADPGEEDAAEGKEAEDGFDASALVGAERVEEDGCSPVACKPRTCCPMARSRSSCAAVRAAGSPPRHAFSTDAVPVNSPSAAPSTPRLNRAFFRYPVAALSPGWLAKNCVTGPLSAGTFAARFAKFAECASNAAVVRTVVIARLAAVPRAWSFPAPMRPTAPCAKPSDIS